MVSILFRFAKFVFLLENMILISTLLTVFTECKRHELISFFVVLRYLLWHIRRRPARPAKETSHGPAFAEEKLENRTLYPRGPHRGGRPGFYIIRKSASADAPGAAPRSIKYKKEWKACGKSGWSRFM